MTLKKNQNRHKGSLLFCMKLKFTFNISIALIFSFESSFEYFFPKMEMASSDVQLYYTLGIDKIN